MFKIVSPTLPEELKTILSVSVVDIQLTDDALANDVTFTWDKSIAKKDAKRGVYTYVALHEAIPQEEMSEIRGLIFRILSRLGEGMSFLCFMTGRVPDCDVRGFENRLELGAYHERMRMNGGLIVAEMDVEELAYSMAYFGNYDTMRGVALTPEGLNGICADLRLFEPLPTTDDNTSFQRPRYNAIQIAMKHGFFVFEEINNGTRLRITSTSIAQQDLVRKVEGLIQEHVERRP